MITKNIPFGWRVLVVGEEQEPHDWFFSDDYKWHAHGTWGPKIRFDYRWTVIRRVDSTVNADPNIVPEIVDDPNNVSTRESHVPFGWRKLEDGERQGLTAWYWACGRWNKNSKESEDRVMGNYRFSSNYWTHIRKLSDDETVSLRSLQELNNRIVELQAMNAKLSVVNGDLKEVAQKLKSQITALYAEISKLSMENTSLKDESNRMKNEIAAYSYGILNSITKSPKVGDMVTVKKHKQNRDLSYIGDKLEVVSINYPNMVVNRIGSYLIDIDRGIKLNLEQWEIIPYAGTNAIELRRKAEYEFRHNGDEFLYQ